LQSTTGALALSESPPNNPIEIRLGHVEQDQNAIRQRMHEIANSLQEVVGQLSDLQHTMSDQNKTLDGQNKMLDKLDVAINGNGKPGIKDGIVAINSRLDRHDAWITVWNKMLLVFGTCIVSLTVAALWRVITLGNK
jgi:hypothetical protein